jgi:hypothetical protein
MLTAMNTGEAPEASGHSAHSPFALPTGWDGGKKIRVSVILSVTKN